MIRYCRLRRYLACPCLTVQKNGPLQDWKCTRMQPHPGRRRFALSDSPRWRWIVHFEISYAFMGRCDFQRVSTSKREKSIYYHERDSTNRLGKCALKN